MEDGFDEREYANEMLGKFTTEYIMTPELGHMGENGEFILAKLPAEIRNKVNSVGQAIELGADEEVAKSAILRVIDVFKSRKELVREALNSAPSLQKYESLLDEPGDPK